MAEVENLDLVRECAVKNLSDFQARYTHHLKKDHQGLPASTCHSCISLQASIRSNTWTIRDVDNGTFKEMATAAAKRSQKK